MIKQALHFDIKYASINILDILAADDVSQESEADTFRTQIGRLSNANWTPLVRHPHADRMQVARRTPAVLFLSSTVATNMEMTVSSSKMLVRVNTMTYRYINKRK